MPKVFTILLLIFALCCSPERNTQVESHTWVLIDKKAAPRYSFVNVNYVWLIWESSNTGVEYWEYIEEEKAHSFIVGMKITNRDRR